MKIEDAMHRSEKQLKPDFSTGNLSRRLSVLSRYVKENPNKDAHGLINLHIHTNESFSVFQNPTEAVWYAYGEGIEYFGINDHYTIDGHNEFRSACALAGIKAAFSIEAVAKDDESFNKERRYNDPNNPGRIYLVGKGITRDLRPGSRGYHLLETMRNSIRERNRKIVHKLNHYAEPKNISLELHYAHAEALTPRGNTTERHVVQAFCEKLNSSYPLIDERKKVYETLLGIEVDEEILLSSADLQNLVRAKLIKSGRPCYVEEDSKAFTTVENLVDLYLEYGAVPTYPLMGNPITEEEEDLEKLIKKMQAHRLYALDLMDFRTEVDRAGEIIDAASRHGIPVFIGTEHNTKTMIPLIGPVGGMPEFYNYFKRSANFILGHQRLGVLCDFGAVTQEGKLRYQDLKGGFQFYEHIGEMDISEEQIDELKKNDVKERRRFFGIAL